MRTARIKNWTVDEEEFLKQLVGLKKDVATQTVEKDFTYPQFFLDSLAYHSPSDWSVLINERKFTQGTAQAANDPARHRIDQDRVQVEWRPGIV